MSQITPEIELSTKQSLLLKSGLIAETATGCQEAFWILLFLGSPLQRLLWPFRHTWRKSYSLGCHICEIELFDDNAAEEIGGNLCWAIRQPGEVQPYLGIWVVSLKANAAKRESKHKTSHLPISGQEGIACRNKWYYRIAGEPPRKSLREVSGYCGVLVLPEASVVQSRKALNETWKQRHSRERFIFEVWKMAFHISSSSLQTPALT